MGCPVRKEAMKMYSPKIREDLIPIIYHAAKKGKVHMATFVNRILEKALNGGDDLAINQIISTGKESYLQKEDGGDHGEP
jgi:hypothetical protein